MKMTGMIAVAGAALLAGSMFCSAAENGGGKKKILFYSQSFGYRHGVVTRPLTGELSHAEKVLKEIGGKAGYEIYVSQDFNDLRDLKQYDAIVFYTTGNPLIDRNGLLKWLRDGGALIGIHTATDTFHDTMQADVPMEGDTKAKLVIPDWPEYTHIIGGAFKTHGRHHEPVPIKIEDPKSPATDMLPSNWKIGDEIYQFNRFSRDNVHVLLSVDTSKMEDSNLKGHNMKKGEDYPVAWTRTEGKGRIFYTSLGHREDVWTNPLWQKHLLGGIAWALGEKEAK